MNGSLIAWPPPLTSLLLRLIPAPTSYSLVRAGRPSSRSAAFAVVPPMSSEIRFGRPDQATELAARDDAGCRARLDEVRRLPRRDRGRKRAAARLHDLERSVDPRVAQAVRERVDVPPDGGAEVRVDDGGARALVLADLGEDVGRPGHEDVVGDALAQDLLDPALVGVVGVRVEERDRHRLDVAAPTSSRRDVLDRGARRARARPRLAGRGARAPRSEARAGTSGSGFSYWRS